MMTLSRFLRVVCLSLFMVLCFACGAAGQTETASVSGLVTDRTGATVPGAEIRLQSVERGTVTTTTTNDAGIYVFPSVQPGRFQLSVHKQGFKQVDLLGLIVNVQDHIEQNFHLEIGSVAESVTVEGGAPLINTTDAAVSTVVDRQFAENLPMNGRSFQTLIQLTPGVVLTTTNSSDNGQFSVNGQRASSNYWTVDGVSANIGIGVNPANSQAGNGLAGAVGSFSAQGGTNSLVSVDAMQEFRIQTSTYAPEFGRTPGGQISIVTRSGTNQFHGTAFDYFRNDVLDSSDWFANSLGLPKPKERQNDFGGTLGGPILKDKTFFFFSYEGLRLRLPQTTLTSVPCDSSCQVFGNARAMAVPAMQPFLNAYPLPNGPEVFTPCTPNVNGCPASGQQSRGAGQFNATYSNPATLDAYSIRIDHKITDRLTVFGRYNYSPSEIIQRGAGNIQSLSSLNKIRISTQTATIGAIWAISSSTSNDLRVNYSRANSSSEYTTDNIGGAVPLTSLPFPSSYSVQNSIFSFFISPLKQGEYSIGNNAENNQRQINIVDGFSAQEGAHSLKFGVDFRRLSPLSAPFAYEQLPFFLSVSSAVQGNAFETVVQSNLARTLLFRNLGIYGQDTWRVRSNLTLTYGLRWDIDFVPRSVSGPTFPAVTGFDLNNLSTLALAPAGTPPYKTAYGSVAPRLGIAYKLSQSQEWERVVRGGVGVFYDLSSSEAGNSLGIGSYPWGSQAVHFFGSFPLAPAATVPPPITAASLSSGELLAFDPHLKPPYALEWNVALEQALGRQQTISASYIGSVGRRLFQTAFIISSPNPNFGSTQLVTNEGVSNYNALQLQYQRRLSRGLQALASYTWAHSIDTGSAGSTLVGANALTPSSLGNGNRASSDFDIRNAFSAALTYEVPAPRINVFTRTIVGGWSVQSIIQARSAPPVDISDALFFGQFTSGFFGDIRPDLVAGQPLYLHGPQYPGGKAFNPAAFQDTPVDPNTGFTPLRQGNVPRNFLRGFWATQWDFAVHRSFPIRESLQLQFRAEIFNILNHPNFGPPASSFGSGGFGLSSQMLGQSLGGQGSTGIGGFNPLYQIGGPRSVQLALKLIF